MTTKSKAKSPVRKPFDPSIGLTKDEWESMTERRKQVMRNHINLWGPEGQKEEKYKKMVEALLGGTKTWEAWEAEHFSIKAYDFGCLFFFHEINLYISMFAKNVSFEDTTFNEQVNFIEVKFKNWTSFEGAIFNKDATFFQVTFVDEVHFQGAIFNKDASFQQTRFDNHAAFMLTTFAKSANLSHARFQGSGFFNEAIFEGDIVDFSEMTLSADSNLLFANVKFKHAVPDFRYLNRRPDMRFHNFSVPAPNKLNPENKWQKDNEDRYRKLKELAIGNDNHEYELRFYGYEMDSKLRNFYKIIEKIICNKKWKRLYDKRWWGFCIKKIFCNKKWWVDIVPTCLYKRFSNYGQSMWRPLICLAVLAVIFYNPYLDWNAISKTILSWLPFINNIDLVMICKTILPLPLFTFANSDDGIKLISDGAFAIKTIASFFWFLFFLAMRNKFKIK